MLDLLKSLTITYCFTVILYGAREGLRTAGDFYAFNDNLFKMSRAPISVQN